MDLTAPAIWPELREELRLHHGPSEANGQPTWTVQDPVRHRFLRIDWTTYEILRRWWMANPEQIANDICEHTTLNVGPSDVGVVLTLALREELVHPTQAPASATRPRPSGWQAGLQWLLHHYLFFRIPLVQPDRLLQALLPAVRWLGGRAFTQLTLLALAGGLLGVMQQSEALGAQWLDLLSWQGLALYGTTLALVKLAHELGHALVAKHEGCRVPSMGVALMVLWPVAYTDTTEAWRLADHRARLRIAAAGVRTELSIAAWATLAWSWLPDGPWRTAVFILATMTWVTSLLINLSPFMRFDGYFLLCDATGQANLHERSFALARWWLRRLLLGWQSAPPEDLPSLQRQAMLAFALSTWVYRLSLYLGIAWMVYHFGFKAMGLLLFMVEMGWFILGPLGRELHVWREGMGQWWHQARARHSAAALALLLAIGFVPWPTRVSCAALMQPAQHLALRLPASVMVDALPVQVGQTVHAGDTLLRTSVPSLTQQQATTQARIRDLEREVASAALSPEQQSRWGSLQAELATAHEQARATQQELARYQPTAPFDGVIVDIDASLKPGVMSPASRETVMHLASAGHWRVVAYADEATARGLHPGATVKMGVDANPLQHWAGHITSVAPHPSAQLDEALLAQGNGGQLDARETAAGWVPTQAVYRVEVDVDEAPPMAPRAWRGHVIFTGEPHSLWSSAWNAGLSALVREAGF